MILNKNGSSEEEIIKLTPFRELRVRLIGGESFLIISSTKKDLANYFGKYYQYFMLYFKGLLEYKEYSEITEEDYNRNMIEF